MALERRQQIGLIEAFLNPQAFTASAGTLSAASDEVATGAIIRGMSRQVGNEIDEFVVEALRNNLLGLPLDLAAINIARGRETGIPSLNDARSQFFAMTADAQLKPYTSWLDFAQNIKHPASIINFIAAYGKHTALMRADVDTLEEQRAIATALVLGGDVTINGGTDDADGGRRLRRSPRVPDRAPERGRRKTPVSTMSTCGSAAWPRR